MKIITNADDFGMSEEVNAATIECFERGCLTSATIMPRMPGTAEAVAYALRRPELSFGVHLTYVGDTIEAPVGDPSNIPDLVQSCGLFRPSNEVRLLALRNRLSVDQIALETQAQIQSLVDKGVRISHVDSHGHLHKYRPFRRALRAVLPKFGISRVRSSQDLYLKKPYKSLNYWYGPIWSRKIRQYFVTTDHFYMPSSARDTCWHDSLLGLFPTLSGSTIEVGVHPGYSESWRADERSEVLAFGDEARRLGYPLIGWSQL